jgi:glyoxylase-like metal-dependent hydrolase (beta-lactamase superfamily II)
MIRVRAIQTGRVKVKSAQLRRGEGGGLNRVLLGREWSEWLPIYAWVVEHPEGVIVVDTGETARTSESGYFPWWQPYYRLAVRMDVSAELEIGPQLRKIGISPDAVWKVVLTHLHTDHAGGLHHFHKSEIIVSGDEYRNAQGLSGQVQGYLPHRWPDWFAPKPIRFEPKAVGPFEKSYPLTEAGDVIIVPTTGHTPNHVSVIVKTEEVSYFLAGDTSYSEEILLDRHPDGVSPDAEVAVHTMDTILRYASAEPTVYLPTHDPHSGERLSDKRVLKPGG